MRDVQEAHALLDTPVPNSVFDLARDEEHTFPVRAEFKRIF